MDIGITRASIPEKQDFVLIQEEDKEKKICPISHLPPLLTFNIPRLNHLIMEMRLMLPQKQWKTMVVMEEVDDRQKIV